MRNSRQNEAWKTSGVDTSKCRQTIPVQTYSISAGVLYRDRHTISVRMYYTLWMQYTSANVLCRYRHTIQVRMYYSGADVLSRCGCTIISAGAPYRYRHTIQVRM